MTTRQNRIILVLCAILLLLSSYVIATEYSKHRRHEIFTNEVYFLLKDLHTEMTNQENEKLKLSFRLNEILIELDVTCILQSQEMWTKFSYPRPGAFDLIKSNISKGIYSQEELAELSMDIQMLINELSNENGNAENNDLTCKELNSILGIFFRKWGN